MIRLLASMVLLVISLASFAEVRAEVPKPLRVGYIVNGPQKTVFEEQFELGMK